MINTNMPIMPRTIGERPIQPLAVLALVTGIAITGSVTSWVVAYDLSFNPLLGTPIFGPVYAPWAWLGWLWIAYNPISGVDFLTHRPHYVPIVYRALTTIPWSLGIGGAVSLVTYLTLTARLAPPKDEVAGIVDSAHFATVEEIREKGFLTANCGPIFGKVETQPGIYENLRWSHNVGFNIVGTQGVGKTSDAIMTQLLNPLMHPEAPTWSAIERRAHSYGYEPNFVVLDVKGSITDATIGYQQNVLGKNVYLMSLLSDNNGLAGFCPFHFIRIGTPHEFDDCYSHTLDIVDEGEGLKDYWTKVALDFGAALIATVGYMSLAANDPAMFSHHGLLAYISRFSTPDALMKDMLEQEHDPHGIFDWPELKNGQPTGKTSKQRQWIIDAATRMNARVEEEKSGIFGAFVSYIGMYASEVMRPHITRTTFDLKAMANDPNKASVLYIQMPDSDLQQIRPFVRIMFKNFFRQLMHQTITIGGRELPGNIRLTRFILDEVRTLNKLEPLAVSSGVMRSHKVQLDTVWQQRNQIEECYGKTETITGNLGIHVYYRTTPGGDSEWLSKRCGQTSTVLQHRNLSGKRMALKGHLAEHNQVQTRYILTESEANDLPVDEKIVFAEGLIMRVKQVRYNQNPIMNARSLIPGKKISHIGVKQPFYRENLAKRCGPSTLLRLTTRPPDRWAENRNQAEILPNHCRVRRFEDRDAETGARIFLAQVWLPSANKPILDDQFPTFAQREKMIQTTLDAFAANEPEIPSEPIFIEHNLDPAVSFSFAVEQGSNV